MKDDNNKSIIKNLKLKKYIKEGHSIQIQGSVWEKSIFGQEYINIAI